MPKNILKSKLENLRIRLILEEIEKLLGINFSIRMMKRLLFSLKNLWNRQEKNEMLLSIDKKVEVPCEVKLIDSHRELRGHWFVLQQAIKSGDKTRLRIALDTDGRMLLAKANRYIKEKEEVLRVLSV